MIRALIFDFFGVIIDLQDERRDQAVLDYILELKGRGYKLGLLSNISRSGLDRRLAPEDQQRFFDVAIPTDEVGMAKPDPDVFVHAAERLGVVPAECIMIDDTEGHCTGARQAGLQAIHYVSAADLRQVLEPLLASLASQSAV